MYLLCAKSPQGPPLAQGQSPLFKTTIDEVPEDTKILDLRSKIAELLQMEASSFTLLYCGRILNDEKTVKEYGIKSTSSVHVIPKVPFNNHVMHEQWSGRCAQDGVCRQSRFQVVVCAHPEFRTSRLA